jgi:hypothetical protein
MGSNIVADATENDRPPFGVRLTDRRRPGRMDYQNAELIALLRGQSRPIDPAKKQAKANPKALSVDDMAPARGIIIGVSIGAAMWVAIIFAVWHFA